MSRVQWKTKRIVGLAAALLVFYLTIKAQKIPHNAFALLPKTNPSHVWEFMADFSNMKILNPSIVDFNIIQESGNYDHWRYSVEYTEYLSHWPYFHNSAIADFSVKTNPKSNIYHIYSQHRTCFFKGLYCLYTTSELKFSPSNSGDGTLFEELIEYQCPWILSSLCKREVVFQRTAIVNNLKKHFAHIHNR